MYIHGHRMFKCTQYLDIMYNIMYATSFCWYERIVYNTSSIAVYIAYIKWYHMGQHAQWYVAKNSVGFQLNTTGWTVGLLFGWESCSWQVSIPLLFLLSNTHTQLTCKTYWSRICRFRTSKNVCSYSTEYVALPCSSLLELLSQSGHSNNRDMDTPFHVL